MNSISDFKGVLLMMLFFSVVITMYSYALPEETLTYVNSFSEAINGGTLNETGALLQGTLEQETNIPVIDLGALIFYSGNIMIDLLLNFVFALPEIVGLLVHGFAQLVGVDIYIWNLVELFCVVAISALYVVGLLQMIINMRSRGGVV